MNEWAFDIAAPSRRNMSRIGANDFDEFLKGGQQIKAEVCAVLAGLGIELSGKKVLDFGCGCGRLYLPMFFETQAEMYGTDIDHTAIDYLRYVTQCDRLDVNHFSPPLSYEEGFFDAVISISIWTHLAPDVGMQWLKEIHRVLKPGGVALISTAGIKTLVNRRERSDSAWLKAWKDVSDVDLESKGVIFKEYENLATNPKLFVGVEGSYGLATNHPEQIKRDWSSIFREVDVKEACIAYQDLAILHKSGGGL